MSRNVSGSSLREHYAAVAKAKGKVFEEPTLPAALRYLWNHFTILHRTRSGNGFGPNPISWQEMLAYCMLSRTHLSPWEVDALMALDGAFMASTVDNEPTPVTTEK